MYILNNILSQQYHIVNFRFFLASKTVGFLKVIWRNDKRRWHSYTLTCRAITDLFLCCSISMTIYGRCRIVPSWYFWSRSFSNTLGVHFPTKSLKEIPWNRRHISFMHLSRLSPKKVSRCSGKKVHCN